MKGVPVPELSVVVIVRDDHDSVRRLIAALGRQERMADASLEIIVVDDGSAIPVTSVLDDPGDDVPFTVLRREGKGNRSAARAEGAEAAEGRYLAFLDADQEPPSHWASEHLRWQRAFPSAVVAGHRRHRTQPGAQLWQPEVRTRVTAEYSDNYARIAGAWYLPFSCNLSVPADVYRSIGGYSDSYIGWGFEDHDFGYRAWASGTPTVHNPHAWTWDHHHVVRTDTARVAEWEANRRRFLSRHSDAHAQAVALIDNYPSGQEASPGQQWLDSFRRFDGELRRIDGHSPPRPSERTLTVLSQADAEHVLRLLDEGTPLRVVDGLNASGLDLHIQRRRLSHIEYHVIETRSG